MCLRRVEIVVQRCLHAFHGLARERFHVLIGALGKVAAREPQPEIAHLVDTARGLLESVEGKVELIAIRNGGQQKSN